MSCDECARLRAQHDDLTEVYNRVLHELDSSQKHVAELEVRLTDERDAHLDTAEKATERVAELETCSLRLESILGMVREEVGQDNCTKCALLITGEMFGEDGKYYHPDCAPPIVAQVCSMGVQGCPQDFNHTHGYDVEKATQVCKHEWGIDGQHSNEFCKKCFVNKERSDVPSM